MSLQILIQRLDPDMPEPQYARAGDAGFDLHTREQVTIAPGERVQISTGIAVAIPEGYVGLVWDKSGLSHRHGLKSLGGVVDAGYRGEVLVGLINLGSEPHVLERHHKVAQMLVQKIEVVEFQEVDALSETERGTQGFGSSGK